MSIEQALIYASQTHPGRVRAQNEDSLSIEPACGLAVLADGVGGGKAGEIASGIAVSVLTTTTKKALQKRSPEKLHRSGEEVGLRLLRENMRKVNAALFQTAQVQTQYAGMSTTAVAALFYDNRVAVAHVGDSRMYRLRGNMFDVITRDHSVMQEQIDKGAISRADARLSRSRHLITRALGMEQHVEVEAHVHAVMVGDVYLLCSDGLHDMMEDREIGELLYAAQNDLPHAALQLVEAANRHGGHDNISVILIRVKQEFTAPRGWEKWRLKFRRKR
jgi:protein phosphatase